jgi:hypothetical protein
MSKAKLPPLFMFAFLICSFALLGSATAVAQTTSPLLISELRFRGYFGSNDEYVELYNNTDSDILVNTTDGSAGWAVAEYGGYRLESAGNAVIPNGTVIKARSHILVVNYYQSSRSVVRLYDCCSYVVYGYFDGHQVGDDLGVAIFTTNNQANFTSAYRLDSVGFSTIPSGQYREGIGLTPIGSTPGEYAFVRRANGFQLQDTDDNLADFQFVSTTGGVWNGVQSRLGGPAPENANSTRRGNLPGNGVPSASLVDTNVQSNIAPNEVRDFQPVGNGAQGTFEIRRKITNTTGASISKLRLRVNDITGYPALPGMADLRVLSSSDKSVQLSNGSTVTVKGTTVDQAPTQFIGGGLNTSISIPLPGGSLANGASVNIRVLFGVMQVGNYSFETDIPLGNTQGTILPGASNASIFGKVGNTSDGPTIGFGGVTVTLSGSQSATTTTDANGNYAFDNLLAGGSYSISPSKAGFTFAPILQQVVNLSGNQEVDFNGGFNKPQPGDIVFSEFRERGPLGGGDEFIELYNNTDIDFTVSTDDESEGWLVSETNNYFLVRNGTVIKARQHIVGTFFYNSYGGGPSLVNTYAGINPFDYSNWGYYDGFQLGDDQGLALFKTNNPAHFNTAYRLDSVGFSNTANSLYKEGSGLTPMGIAQPEYSFVRRQTGFTAQDTDNNLADFVMVATDGGVYNGTQSVLGAPGPETSSAPIRGNLPGVCGLTKSLLDPDVAANSGANFINGGGTISIRRKITNGSSTKMTRVRFRVVDISTLGNRGPGEADLRIVSSPDTTATLSNGTTVTVKGTTLDEPPSQPNGGGLNSSLSVALPAGGLNPGASINVQFLLNVMQPGNYRFDIDTSDLPCDTTGPTTTATVNPAANGAGWNKTDVAVILNAVDNGSGSGIKDINYVASGGQSIPLTTVNSTSLTVPINVEGQTIITYFARDNASNTESPQTLVLKIDKTAPSISNLPSPVVEASGPSGATVTWTGPSVSDNLDSSPSLSCSRISGSDFPIGDTQVNCTASDQAGNSSTTSFTVTVNPPPVPPVSAGSIQRWSVTNGFYALTAFNDGTLLAASDAFVSGPGSGVKLNPHSGATIGPFPFPVPDVRSSIRLSTGDQDYVIGGYENRSEVRQDGSFVRSLTTLGCCNIPRHPLALDQVNDVAYALANAALVGANMTTGSINQRNSSGDSFGMVMISDPTTLYTAGQQGNVTRVNPAAGPQWFVHIDGISLQPGAVAADASFIVASGAAHFGGSPQPGRLARVRPDGSVAWNNMVNAVTPPVIGSRNLVFVGTQAPPIDPNGTGAIEAYDLTSGVRVWRRVVQGLPNDLLVGDDGSIYAGTGSFSSGSVYALDQSNGATRQTVTNVPGAWEIILRGGLLYASGASITALPVEAVNYDPNSPWPVRFHDNQRTGNRQTPLLTAPRDLADQSAPLTSGSLSVVPNGAGWNNSDVAITFTALDESGGSGVQTLTYSASGAQTVPATTVNGSTANLSVTAEGITTVTYFARDNAGNIEMAKTLVIRIDKTAPVINASRSPAANPAGWNREDVTANYSASDALSGLDAGSPSTGSFVFSTEGGDQSHTFTVMDAAGNTTSVTIANVNIDKTAPTIDSQATAGGNPYSEDTWTNHPVTLTFSCHDSGSGVANVTQPITLGGEGINQSAAGVCTDVAGNTSDTTFDHIKIDMTAPTIDVSHTPAANAAGWNKENVVANYTASDALSGLGSGSPGSGSFTFTSQGSSQSHTFTVTDAAGNTSSAAIDHVNIDKTAPALSCAPADGAWHASDVSIACTATETISALAESADSNFNLTTSVATGIETGDAATNSHGVCDIAGNCATAGPISNNKVDKKAPVIMITAPTAGNYLLNQVVTVQFTCTDGGSGVASCSGTSANGGPLDTASVGARTFTVNATDNAGNSAAPASINYTVGYGVVVLYDQTKAAKSGSTIPIKIRLVDANGANVSSPATTVHAVSVVQVSSQSSPALQDAGNANPDFDFRYDSGLAGYIFNLQTTGFASGSFLLNFVAGGGSPMYSVGFQVRQ